MFCDMATIKDDGTYVDAYGKKIDGAMAVEV